jgi:hypothetical protein
MKCRFDVSIGKLLLSSILGFTGFAVQTEAQIKTMTDGNSVAQINTSSQAGMFSWTVDGLNQLAQQWFWYRVGASGPEFSIDTIGAPTSTQTNANVLTTVYTGSQLSVRLDYVLRGGTPGSGTADLNEQVTINNLSGAPLALHFFQYSDFDLNGTAGGDTVQLGKNGSGLYNLADQTKGATTLAETVTTPGANEGEAAFFNSTLVKLNNGVADTLNNNAGPVGPGDVTWALEWDTTIATGGSFIIGKDKNITGVPEPGTFALMSVGLLVWAWRRAHPQAKRQAS